MAQQNSFGAHGAYLVAVGKIMIIHGVPALIAVQGNYDKQLMQFMMQEGLSKEEANAELLTELSDAITAQV